ncbi:MAG TPA: HisA/HisF-related TIM barrel protein, partial [Gemmatimonadaceae bacterium]|nr:HisA/HisF-related TIM barrel protein [Gemmatimonadaceae bacterium]
AVRLPIIGTGGVGAATDVLQYLMAGATLVAIGTAAMQNPKLPAKLVRDLAVWCSAHGVRSIDEIKGTLSWKN